MSSNGKEKMKTKRKRKDPAPKAAKKGNPKSADEEIEKVVRQLPRIKLEEILVQAVLTGGLSRSEVMTCAPKVPPNHSIRNVQVGWQNSTSHSYCGPQSLKKGAAAACSAFDFSNRVGLFTPLDLELHRSIFEGRWSRLVCLFIHSFKLRVRFSCANFNRKPSFVC